MPFTLYEVMATKSPCYKEARAINPSGIVVHSTGANNPYLKRYVQPDDGQLGVNVYNNSVNREDWYVIAHAYIGKDKDGKVKCYQVLPFNIACWSAGGGSKGSYNYNPQGHIQFEICEDGLTDETYFNEAFNCAAEFCAFLCREFNLSVNSICSHKEAHARGYASNHGDPENWLSEFSKDMNWFRNKVVKLLENDESTTVYRVQVGAFSNREYAEKLLADLKKDGYSGFIVQSQVLPPEPPQIAVGDEVSLLSDAVIYGTERKFADFVYESALFVRELSGTRAVIALTPTGEITGATDVKYLKKLN
ncbi:MAG: N-acetylmuramoyl-L-alanine amidase [Clostridia bacterium]|nr:N-acetylmuramoyl-L-alanine amidase [Clostridia bacterium]